MSVARASIGNIRSIHLILTTKCNLSCSYCFQNSKTAGRMSWETLRRSIDLALRSKHEQVEFVFYGGEPLLELPLIRRAVDYVSHARPAGKTPRYSLITNGTLLGTEALAFLEDHEFEVQLSFDGVEQAQRNRGAHTFPLLDRLLDRLRKERPAFLRHALTVNSTLTPGTVEYMADSFEYLVHKGIRSVAVTPVFTHVTGWNPEGFAELERQFERLEDSSLRFFRLIRQTPLLLFRQTASEPASTASSSLCGMMTGAVLSVGVDGRVYPCTTLVDSYQTFPPGILRDQLGGLELGRSDHQEFEERFASLPDLVDPIEIFHRKGMKHSSYGSCESCEYLASCSICPVSIGHIPDNQDPHRVPDFLCAFSRVSQKSRARFLDRVQRDVALFPGSSLRNRTWPSSGLARGR